MPKEAESIAKGLDYILTLPEDADLNPELLLHLHKICFDWIFPTWAGQYRTIAVQTSTHEFPSHTKVPMLVKDFFADLNERLLHQFDPIDIIAWAQHRLVWIHPFQDYNGRIARLFSNYVMLRCHLPLSEIKIESESDRISYIKSLKLADQGDFTLLEKLIRDAIKTEEK